MPLAQKGILVKAEEGQGGLQESQNELSTSPLLDAVLQRGAAWACFQERDCLCT